MTRPPVVLGLWDGHGATACLVAEGELLFALAEERPTRRKRFSGFPTLALELALEEAGRRGLEVSHVALAGRWGRAPLRWAGSHYTRGDPHRHPLSLGSRLIMGWENTVARHPGLREQEARLGLIPLRHRLRASGCPPVPLHLVDHHDAHAFSALLGPREPGALVVTADAYGEDVAGTLRRASRPLEVLDRVGPAFGLAWLYGAVTVALGFKEGDDGKLMGLAARGRVEPAYSRFRSLFQVARGGPRLARPLRWGVLRALVDDLPGEDVAAGLQACVEHLASGWVEGMRAEHPEASQLLLAGGLFANILLNRRLAALEGVGGVAVFPAMGDDGLAAGAAHAVWHRLTGTLLAPLRHVFLGPTSQSSAIIAALQEAGLPWRRVEPTRAAVDHLAAGRVVCRYTGGDEYGPRALGHRSVLFSPADPALGERVNQALGRDTFMPFGPSLAAPAARRAWLDGAGADLRYMNVAVAARDVFRQRCPLAVHLDGTSRPQVVQQATDPAYFGLLAAFEQRTGLPAVINTSFNLHGEPIVHSPQDALRTFRASGLDVLLLGEVEVRSASPAP